MIYRRPLDLSQFILSALGTQEFSHIAARSKVEQGEGRELVCTIEAQIEVLRSVIEEKKKRVAAIDHVTRMFVTEISAFCELNLDFRTIIRA